MPNEESMTEFELAMLASVQIIMELLIRGNVPAHEFEEQFKLVTGKLKDHPKALKIIDGLDRYTKQRLAHWHDEGTTKLRNAPTEGSA